MEHVAVHSGGMETGATSHFICVLSIAQDEDHVEKLGSVIVSLDSLAMLVPM